MSLFTQAWSKHQPSIKWRLILLCNKWCDMQFRMTIAIQSTPNTRISLHSQTHSKFEKYKYVYYIYIIILCESLLLFFAYYYFCYCYYCAHSRKLCCYIYTLLELPSHPAHLVKLGITVKHLSEFVMQYFLELRAWSFALCVYSEVSHRVL